MRRLLLVLILFFTGITPAQAEENQMIVASRNLYLGADVGVALDLIPDFAAAAQFMWDQVAATDFTKRAPALAKEVIASGADVVGLQEATNWYCKKDFWSKKVVVYNFTQEFLTATKAAGNEYVLASKDGVSALNIGYSIPAIPHLTMVNDPATFQPLFGSDSAACGFEIGDALIVKKNLASHILQVGNVEYEKSYTIVPTIMNIFRGYTWADIDYYGSKVRVITTHLESLWDPDKVPNSAIQAQQLVQDLKDTKMPTIVIGDFNSDPRDPRRDSASNPGGQPEASATCPLKAHSCNAYWIMRDAGFVDVGPDATDPANFTWGMSTLLAGPEMNRYKAAYDLGNKFGFTDRLDYIFLKNGAEARAARLIGNTWPNGSTWNCSKEDQVKNAQEISNAMGIKNPESNFCNDTDHAGVVAVISLPDNHEISPALDPHSQFPFGLWRGVGALLLVFIGYRIKRRVSTVRRGREVGEM